MEIALKLLGLIVTVAVAILGSAWFESKTGTQVCLGVRSINGKRDFVQVLNKDGQTMESCAADAKVSDFQHFTLGCEGRVSNHLYFRNGGANTITPDLSDNAVEQTFPFANCGWKRVSQGPK